MPHHTNRKNYKMTPNKLFSTYRISIMKMFAFLLIAFGIPNGAQADWRKDIGTFKIGIVAGNDIAGTLTRIEPFRAAVSKALGLKVEIFPARNYQTLINAQTAARIEYVIYSASAYATAWKACKCVEPLVVPRSGDDASIYYSIIIAAENGPQSTSQLASAKLVGLSKTSFAGHLFAVQQLKSQGVNLPEKIEFETSGEEALVQFAKGKYNALIGWSSLAGDKARGYSRGTLNMLTKKSYKVIWQSSPIPHRPHVVKKSLAGEAKNLLRNALTELFKSDPVAYDAVEPVFSGGFIVARHSQFQPIISYVDALVPSATDTKPAQPDNLPKTEKP